MAKANASAGRGPATGGHGTDRARFLTPPRSGDLWIFGYGSLIWNPGFAHLAAEPGLVYGYHRRFCMISHRHRGTREVPGLVLALARGGCCRGMAFRVARQDAEAVLAYLWDREMLRYAYRPSSLRVRLQSGPVAARTFVADPAGANYAGRLAFESIVRIIRQARGERGTNRDYLARTVASLRTLGIADGQLRRLLRAVESAEGNPS